MNAAPIPSPDSETKRADSAPVSRPPFVAKWGRMLISIILWCGLFWCGPLAVVSAFGAYGVATGFPAPENTLLIMVKMCVSNSLAAIFCFFFIGKMRQRKQK